MNLKVLAEQLGRAKAVPSGYVCRCPCHDDNEASLSLKITDSGSLAVNCFAGCDWQTVWTELQSRGLLPRKKKEGAPSTGAPPHRHTDPPILYTYTNDKGEPLFQKMRFPNKKFAHRRYDSDSKSWINNLKGVPPILYNIVAVREATLVYLCEGEKDADNLIAAGLVATTNHCGALTWKDEYSKQLSGKSVIILQDNDDAGRSRTEKLKIKLSKVVKELRLFEPPGVPDHGDVSDWLAAGGNASQILSLSTSLMEDRSPAKGKATRAMFFDLYDRVLKNPRKCIFSEKLMTLDTQTGLWNPAVNLLDVIKSEAAVVNETSEVKFSLTLVQPHFFAYEQTKIPEFLVELPEWDKRDRISEMAYLVKLKPESGVSEIVFSELLKEWCATMFKRLKDPMVQNRIMVLQGDQGIGKDTWINMLIDGLGQFAVPLAVVREDKDTYLNLHRGLVMKISEFDKTAKAEVSTLKDIITTPSTNIRAPYDRDSKVRHSRCSFISSANIENILRDYTGNRRFLIFEIESIEFPYEFWSDEEKQNWRMQCLAEAAYLAQVDYRASKESATHVKEYIEKKTPDDPADDTVREFAIAVRKDYTLNEREILSEADMVDIMQVIKLRTGLNVRAIREQLRRRIGIYKREADKRFWTYRIPAIQ